MLMKVLQLLILLFTTWSTVSAQNKNGLQFTIVSSETGKSINEKSDYSRETTTTFSIRPAPTFYIETEHVLWSNEESPIATFLKSKVGKSLHFDVSAISGNYNGSDIQNNGKRLSFSTNRSMTSSESDEWFGASTLTRTATGGILSIFIPDFTVWAPWSGGDNQPSECLHYGSYGENGIQIILTNAELSKWEGVTKNWKGSCNIEDSYFSDDLSNSLGLQIQFNYSTEEKPSLQFTGCESLVVGETATLSAEGKPSAGTYRYWSDDNAVSISGSGSEAKITGISPGETTVWVEYTSPKGEKVKKSKTIHSLQVNSINNGKLLQLGLHDAKGRPINALKTVPVSVEPEGKVTLLTFKPADNTLLSAAPTGQSQLKVQGLKKGKSTVQAYSESGTQTGPFLEVEVVDCDDEVVEELRRELKMLRSRLEGNVKQVMEILGDEEFSRSADQIKKSTFMFFRKMAELVIATAGMSNATKGVDAAGKFVDIYNISESVVDGKLDEAGLSAIVLAVGVKDALIGTLAGSVLTAREASLASQQFGRDLGNLFGASERLEELEEQYNKTYKEYEAVQKTLYEVCSREAEQAIKEPEVKGAPEQAASKLQKTSETKVTASGKPKDIEVKEEGSSNEIKKTESDKPDDEVPPPTENKLTNPALLLIGVEDCGCTTSKNALIGISGFRNNIKNMKSCVEALEINALKPLEENLKVLENFGNSLKLFAESPAPDRHQQFQKTKELARIPASQQKQSIDFVEQIELFKENNEKCEDSMTSDLIQKLKIHWDRLL